MPDWFAARTQSVPCLPDASVAAARAQRAGLIFLIGQCVCTCLSTSIGAYFFGPWIAGAWLVAVVGVHVWIHVLGLRSPGQKKGSPRLLLISHLALQLLWTGSSIALFATTNPAAWVFAMAATISLGFHTVFAGSRSTRQQALFLSIAALPLLVFMAIAAWMVFPWYIAIPAGVSGVGTLASIGNAAAVANRNYRRMKASASDARAVQRKLEFAVESIGDGYFEMDLDTSMITPSPALARGLGYRLVRMRAASLRNYVHADDIGSVWEQLEKCKAGDTMGWDQDLRIREASGGFRWMTLRARVLDPIGDGPQLLIGAIVDLMVRKQFEEELQAAKEAADASNQAKSRFLAMMSHEIRTPLNGVLGMAQALSLEPLAPQQKDKVAIILESGQNLTLLLNDVLDLSKIEAGKLEISPTPGDLLQTVNHARQLFEPIALEKGIELAFQAKGQLPASLVYDPVRVRQCVSNLISNAVKFTAAGKVEITLEAAPSAGEVVLVSIEIRDTGIGMSQATLNKLFELFTQADDSTTRRFGGSGLGLAVSRQLARLMGGDITAASVEGCGATFRLTFAAAEAKSAPAISSGLAAGHSTRRSLLGARILLTDDNAINRQVIKLLLAPHGVSITEAVNGADALDKLAGADFDLVLLDVHMPVMDGKEAIRRIRASSEAWSALPVIALTADAMQGDRDRFVALGMSDYLSKPVDQSELVSKLRALLGPDLDNLERAQA